MITFNISCSCSHSKQNECTYSPTPTRALVPPGARQTDYWHMPPCFPTPQQRVNTSTTSSTSHPHADDRGTSTTSSTTTTGAKKEQGPTTGLDLNQLSGQNRWLHGSCGPLEDSGASNSHPQRWVSRKSECSLINTFLTLASTRQTD